MYSEKVLDHFRNPRNMGKIKNLDGVGEVGNPSCGDYITIYIKVRKKNGKEIIKNITFQAFGCTAAIATSSMVTELAKGKTLEESLKISKKDVVDALDGLPPIKAYCSNLATEGLHEAIRQYLAKKEKNYKLGF